MSAPVALVTGASIGIGLGIARRFARDGMRVALVARDEARVRAAAESIGPPASAHACDVGDRAAVTGLIRDVVARHGRLDIVVNNAGVMPLMTLDTPLEEGERILDETLRINVKGAYLVSAAAASHLPARTGRIVNLGSIVSETGGSVPGYLAYAASKAGVTGLTLALARELAAREITVNAVAPGMIGGTGMTGTFDEAAVARIRASVPLGRGGVVDDIAGAVAWLVSEDAAYVTGTVVPVNGGWRFG